MTRRRARSAQAGFTLIELLIVLSILSILVRLSLPAYKGIQRDALASQAVGDFNTVRAAAIAQYEATGAYAADSPEAVIPQGMAPYLPRSYSFTHSAYTLDWDHFAIDDTTASPIAMTSSWSTKLISMSSWVNSG